MKMLTTVLLATLVGLNTAVAEEANHQHGHNISKESSLADKKFEKKFTGDENLKNGMATVLNSMKVMSKNKTKNRIQLQKQTSLKIKLAVQEMFKKCKLAPEADAAIHPVLADLLQGATRIGEGKEAEGHEIIHKALLRYEDSFEHIGWKHDKNH